MTSYVQWLKGWFAERAPEIKLAPEENFFEQGAIDSFGVIELIEEIEENFSIRFSNEDFQDRRFSSIKGLGELLAEKSQP